MDLDPTNPTHQQILMRFLADSLNPTDAAALQGLLDDPMGAMAADAALRRLPAEQRAPLMAMDAKTRRIALDGIVKTRSGHVTPEADKSFTEKFPHHDRLRS